MQPTNTPEEWRPIPGYEGTYEVSSLGQVRRVGGKTLRRNTKSGGYLMVTLCVGGIQENRTIHRLVAETFLERPTWAQCVRHLDGDLDNNTISNLQWGTYSENMMDRIAHGNDTNAAKTHCKSGHLFDEGNTYIRSKGHRSCRTCRRDAQRRYQARKNQRSIES